MPHAHRHSLRHPRRTHPREDDPQDPRRLRAQRVVLASPLHVPFPTPVSRRSSTHAGERKREIHQTARRGCHRSPRSRSYAVSGHVQELRTEQVHPVFLLDEAHLLHQDTLDHLHILLNYEWDSKALLSLVLVGLPELQDRLALRRSRSTRASTGACRSSPSSPQTPLPTSATDSPRPAATANCS